ncbi:MULTISPECIES: VanZ family protein [unclassified Streptomyces]|uniref:VanZ family protein n=1 Tax=Streptomyces sp. NPDC127129 TaxID=3345373 RepID=UPI0036306E61
MITAVFQDHLTFLAIAIAVTLLTGFAVYIVAARRIERASATFYGLWAASTVGPIALTTWGGSGFLSYRCTINPAVTDAFTATQGQLNVLLFAPFGLFAVLATRRPLFGSAIGVLFTAAVETAQATAPFITRLCDTDDLVTNTVGILAGAAIGAFICRRADFGAQLGRGMVRRAAIASTIVSLLIAATWAVAIEPVRAVLPTEAPTASPQQVQALNIALNKAFDDAYIVEQANFHNNIDGPSTVNAPLPGGYAELTWPDREKLTVHFTPSSQGEGTHAFWIPEASRPVHTAQDAEDVATRFTKRHAPWALRDSKVKVWPIDASTNLGWVIERRRWQGEILMPMRLDILIEPSGRMTDLIARHVEDPQLPPVSIGKDAAWKKFEDHHKLKPGQGEREEPVHLVERHQNQWRVHWRLAARHNDMLLSATVDATSGEVRNAAEIPAGAQPPSTDGVRGP